jgi:hypothetical protein
MAPEPRSPALPLTTGAVSPAAEETPMAERDPREITTVRIVRPSSSAGRFPAVTNAVQRLGLLLLALASAAQAVDLPEHVAIDRYQGLIIGDDVMGALPP